MFLEVSLGHTLLEGVDIRVALACHKHGMTCREHECTFLYCSLLLSLGEIQKVIITNKKKKEMQAVD